VPAAGLSQEARPFSPRRSKESSAAQQCEAAVRLTPCAKLLTVLRVTESLAAVPQAGSVMPG